MATKKVTQTNPIDTLTLTTPNNGRYSTPTLTARMRPGVHFREGNAALHKLAAACELATPRSCGWVVQVKDDRSGIYLETIHGNNDPNHTGELVDAIKTLRAAAKAMGGLEFEKDLFLF